jgi:hypothetical protein
MWGLLLQVECAVRATSGPLDFVPPRHEGQVGVWMSAQVVAAPFNFLCIIDLCVQFRLIIRHLELNKLARTFSSLS